MAKKKKTKNNDPAIEHERLLKAAKDLNDTMDLGDDAIDLELSEEDLLNEVKEVGTEVEAGDALKKDTIEVLSELDIDVGALAAATETKDEEEEEDESEPEDEEEEEEDKPEPKVKKAKKAKKKTTKKKEVKGKKETTKKKTERKKRELDEFGFDANRNKSRFVAAIKKKSMTMAEVRELDWNENKRAFYGTWAKLKKMGVAHKTKEGKMTIKKGNKKK